MPIIIGEGTRDAASDFASIEIDFVRVRGRETPVPIFALVGDQALKADERFMEFAARLNAKGTGPARSSFPSAARTIIPI